MANFYFINQLTSAILFGIAYINTLVYLNHLMETPWHEKHHQ